MSLRKNIVEKVKQAVQADPSIVTPLSKIGEAHGNTLARLEQLGLTKQDLKRLEVWKLALRGYTMNYDEKRKKHGPGHNVRWLIIAPGEENGTAEPTQGDAERVPAEGQPAG